MDSENRNQAKKKLRLNAFDLLIIFLIIACIAGIVVRYTVLAKIDSASAYDSYYVYFEASAISHSASVALEETYDDTDGGNWVYLAGGETKVGQMIKGEDGKSEDLITTPSAVYIKDASGKTVSVDYSDVEKDKDHISYDVKNILVVCEGFVSSGSGNFLLNGNTNIAPGSILEVQTKYGDFSLRVTSIEPADAAE